jgi:hypothetical protein
MGQVEIALQARGVNATLSSLVANASLEAIACTIEWWDGLPGAGAGALVEAIRRGGIVPKHRGRSDDAYGREIADWLTAHFPELRQPSGEPHPAAVAAVIRLRYRLGPGQLTRREHGPEIRAAVKAHNRRFAQDGGFSAHERELIARRRAQRESRKLADAQEPEPKVEVEGSKA